jgi:hypothetical protein
LEQIAKMDERIAAARVQMEDRDKTKDVALGTSKINYIDPRLTVAWARKNDVPLEKLFSKTLYVDLSTSQRIFTDIVLGGRSSPGPRQKRTRIGCSEKLRCGLRFPEFSAFPSFALLFHDASLVVVFILHVQFTCFTEALPFAHLGLTLCMHRTCYNSKHNLASGTSYEDDSAVVWWI